LLPNQNRSLGNRPPGKQHSLSCGWSTTSVLHTGGERAELAYSKEMYNTKQQQMLRNISLQASLSAVMLSHNGCVSKKQMFTSVPGRNVRVMLQAWLIWNNKCIYEQGPSQDFFFIGRDPMRRERDAKGTKRRENGAPQPTKRSLRDCQSLWRGLGQTANWEKISVVL